MVVRRLISTWCLTSLVFLLYTGGNITAAEFSSYSTIAFIVVYAALFALITVASTAMRKTKVAVSFDDWILFAGMLIYAFVLATKVCDPFFCLALCALLALVTVFVVSQNKLGLERVKFGRAAKNVTIVAAGLFMFGFIAFVTCCRYIFFNSPNFDFGIWVNMFYNMRKSLLAQTTCERDVLLSHFAVHFSPIWYTLLPIYFLFPYAVTLQICQAAIVASAIVPLVLLCKKFGLSNKVTAAAGVSFALYAALSCSCFYDIHENCFLAPLILWMFYFSESEKKIPMYAFALGVLLVKEDAFIYVFFAGVYFLLSKKKYLRGVIFILLSGLYFGGVYLFMNAFGNGVMAYRYDNFIYGDQSLFGMIINIIKNPASVFYQSFNGSYVDKIKFLIQILVPLGFLPFVTKKVSRLTLVLPMLLINIMTNYKYQYDIGFQYVFGSVAFLFYLSLMNLADLKGKMKKLICLYLVSANCVFFGAEAIPYTASFTSYASRKERNEAFAAAVAAVPDDVSVSCSTFLLPHLAQRDEIYSINADVECDYVVIDLLREKDAEARVEILIEKGYSVVFTEPGYAAVLKRG